MSTATPSSHRHRRQEEQNGQHTAQQQQQQAQLIQVDIPNSLMLAARLYPNEVYTPTRCCEQSPRDYVDDEAVFRNHLILFFAFANVDFTQLSRWPAIGGKEIPLSRLFLEVRNRGGSATVNLYRQWRKIAAVVRAHNSRTCDPMIGTGDSSRFRLVFTRYLADFEKAHFRSVSAMIPPPCPLAMLQQHQDQIPLPSSLPHKPTIVPPGEPIDVPLCEKNSKKQLNNFNNSNSSLPNSNDMMMDDDDEAEEDEYDDVNAASPPRPACMPIDGMLPLAMFPPPVFPGPAVNVNMILAQNKCNPALGSQPPSHRQLPGISSFNVPSFVRLRTASISSSGNLQDNPSQPAEPMAMASKQLSQCLNNNDTACDPMITDSGGGGDAPRGVHGSRSDDDIAAAPS